MVLFYLANVPSSSYIHIFTCRNSSPTLIVQFDQNNSQMLFHITVSLRGAGGFTRDSTTNLTPQCRTFSRALKIGKFKAALFPGPRGALDTNDWCINRFVANLVGNPEDRFCCVAVS